MDNGRITGGSVSFMKRLNKGNYEHEEASVKLDFVVPEEASPSGIFMPAAIEAKSLVLVQLGLQSARPLVPATAPVVQNAATAGVPEVKKVVAHRKSAQIEAMDKAASTGAASTQTTAGQEAVTSQEADDPLAPPAVSQAPSTASSPAPLSTDTAGSVTGDDPLAAVGASAPATQTASPAASGASVGASDDPLAPVGASATTASTPSTDDPFTAQREVTDADLATAAAKKNEALVKIHKEAGTMKIRDLVGQFLPPGKTLRDLAQADRPAFLVKLEALA